MRHRLRVLRRQNVTQVRLAVYTANALCPGGAKRTEKRGPETEEAKERMDQEKVIHAEEMEIDLRELLHQFRQKLLIILAAFLVGGVLTGAVTYFFVKPTYKASSLLYVVSASNDSVVNLSDLQIGTNLTADYEELLLSRPVMESVLRNLKLRETTSVKELREMLSITNKSGTRILEISATTGDPELSADIANEVAELATTWLPAVMECNEPHVAEEAIAPTRRAGPSYVRNTVIGAMVLALLAYGVYVVRYLYDDSIRTEEDMEKYFGLMPLAVIPEENGTAPEEEAAKGNGKRKQGRERKK